MKSDEGFWFVSKPGINNANEEKSKNLKKLCLFVFPLFCVCVI
jgi:hypothetical protein